MIFFNFRADRARQLTRAFVAPDFDGFERPVWPQPLYFVTFGEYESGLPVTAVALPDASKLYSFTQIWLSVRVEPELKYTWRTRSRTEVAHTEGPAAE